MTRHIFDHRTAPDSSQRAARTLQHDKLELGHATQRKLFEHKRETGNARLVRFIKIERGYEA